MDLDGGDDSDISAERLLDVDADVIKPKGACVTVTGTGLFSPKSASIGTHKQCKCNVGYTGPNCLSVDKQDDVKGAYEVKKESSLFTNWSSPYLTRSSVAVVAGFAASFVVFMIVDNVLKARRRFAPRVVTMEQVPLTSNHIPMGR